ncbi:armadillo-type protein [Chlamydoabsidia padenii]|nr:armadillo-type protein [Chlamydoabsidia padenii]
MEKLLQWAVNNSDKEQLKHDAEAIRRGDYKPDPSKFDPKVIEAILGKDDATLMKESVQCIADPNDSIENKEIALDNLELLVEGIDNAKNIQNMGLWPVLIELLEDKDRQVRSGIAWVCGTALQNNPDAQKAFLEHKGLPVLAKLLSSDQKEERAKAQYAVSGLLKHCPAAVEEFQQVNGFKTMLNIMKQNVDDASTLRKVVFLYNTLIFENPILTKEFIKDGIVSALNNVMVKYTAEKDEDMVEKTLRTLHTLIQQQKQQSSGIITDGIKKNIQQAQDTFGADNLNLDTNEWNDLLST